MFSNVLNKQWKTLLFGY